MANRVKFSARMRERFLDVLRATCNVSEAARCCGIARQAAYLHRDADPAFREAWDDAVEEAADALEREAWRRAVEGVDKPITYQGKVTGQYKEYSDRMLELLLKAHRPGKFKDRVANEHVGADAGPIEILSGFTDDELIARLKAKRGERDKADSRLNSGGGHIEARDDQRVFQLSAPGRPSRTSASRQVSTSGQRR